MRTAPALAAAALLAAACGSGTHTNADASPHLVTFVAWVPVTTPSGARIYVSGDRPELGDRNGHGLELTLRDDGRYGGQVAIPAGATVHYKVTRGSLDTAETGAGGVPLEDRVLTVTADTTAQLVVARWPDDPPPSCTPTLTGQVRLHEDVGAGAAVDVKPRNVIVWLPPGYDTDTARRYPVLYMHDGQNLMDRCTSFAGEWRVDETAQALATAGGVAPAIVVGVYNVGSDRIADYTPVPDPTYGGGNADAYARFLLQVVKPLVDATYRTDPAPEVTGVAGSSLGGLVSMYLGLSHPDVFRRLGVMSPSVWWDGRWIVTQVTQLPSRPPLRIWLDIGLSEPGSAVADAEALRDALLAKGWTLGGDLQYLEAPNAQHDEAAWSARFGQVLTYLYPPQ